MVKQAPKHFRFAPEVYQAKKLGKAVVALETTVLTHGLPYPENVELARRMEEIVRQEGATPATIGVIDGKIHIGLEPEQVEILVASSNLRKISRRDFGPAIAQAASGGTTVAGTLIAAHAAEISVFATGGIGGVHRDSPFDISADLPQLARTPVVVVCAGAKAILDLPATLEYLETVGVPVIGYQTDEFPAFYSTESGLPVSARAESPEQVAEIANAHWGLGLESAVLVAVPPPEDVALPVDEVQGAIERALAEAREQDVRGQAVTPFLLARVSKLTGEASLKANLGLLHNNARVAARIAKALGKGKAYRTI
jgi:pseudouridine-5'-phosphate glycosidase